MSKGFTIVNEEIIRKGNFTIATVIDNEGRIAVGISKKSKYDKVNRTMGEKIALGRAKKAMFNKINGKSINNHYMA